MEEFNDCSTHENNTDLLILETIEENCLSITTNNDDVFNIIWLNKEESLKLAKSLIKLANKL